MVQLFILLILIDALLSTILPRRYFHRKFFVIPALIALGTAGYQYYQSRQQEKKAKKLKPSNYVPASVNEAIASSRMAASSQSPGYNRGLEKLKISSANTIDAAKRVGGSSTQIQQAVADTDAREKELVKDLQVSDESFRNSNRNNLNNLLMTKGAYQKDSFDAYNATKSALLGAAAQNKYNAVTTLGEGVVNSLPDSAFESKVKTGDNITGKTGGALTRALTKQEKGSSTLTPEQIEYLKKLGIGKQYDQKKFFTGY